MKKQTTADPSWRFSIGSAMCFTATIAALVAYSKRFEFRELNNAILVIIVVSLATALPCSFLARKREALLWSFVGAATASLCALGEPLTHEWFQVAWPTVGAMAAASSVLLDRYPLPTRMMVGALLGFVLLLVFSQFPSTMDSPFTWIEIGCAPVTAMIMVGIVWVIENMQESLGSSRSVLMFGLTASVTGGNIVARYVGWF